MWQPATLCGSLSIACNGEGAPAKRRAGEAWLPESANLQGCWKGVGGGYHFFYYIIDYQYFNSLRPLSMVTTPPFHFS